MGLTACQDNHADEHKIVLKTPNGAHHEFVVDVVNTDETRAKGLMFVENMPENKGMIFDFSHEKPLKFWMKNTLIPLDMIFFNAHGEVVHIEHSATPHDLTPRGPDESTCMVLEINGGIAKKLKIEEGTKIFSEVAFECLQSRAE